MRPFHPVLRTALWTIFVGTLLGSIPAGAAESAALARAKESVAYEHAHLGLVGSLFCKKEVAWMDQQLADFERALDQKDWSRGEQYEAYVKSAIDDLRHAEDSRTVDAAIVLVLVVLAAAGGFWFMRRRARQAPAV